MELSNKGLENAKEWLDKGYILPKFDRETMIKATLEEPEWVHFGIGNIFRAFICNLSQKLLDEGYTDKGIIAVEGYDGEIVDKISKPCDDYSILVVLNADGTVEKKIIGSVAKSLKLEDENVKKAFRAPTLKMASFTITEKGYQISPDMPEVASDLGKGPAYASTYMGRIAALLYERFTAGAHGISMVSMDNCSHNGDKLKAAIMVFAQGWCENKKADKGFLDYLNDTSKVSFPRTMIDKITPRPDEQVLDILRRDGVENILPVITSKNTYIAPYVNAEKTEYLVIQDCFPNSRPPLENARVMFCDKNTVDKVEKMKVCTCLNPLHTALAVFGCLLGYNRIADEMKNPCLKKMVERIGYEEGLPVVVDPEIIDPKTFLSQVINIRIPNPFIPDTPARIATDTSQKLAVRYGETIKSYLASPTFSASDLKMIPLVFAGWLRYLMGIDDNGEQFSPSPDPRLKEVSSYVDGIKLGDTVDEGRFEELYKDESIFGVNLYRAGLADLVTSYFNEMIKSKGAVDIILKKYVN